MNKNQHVRCGRLGNGVRFYTQYESSNSREMIVIGVMVGSFYDPPNKRGLSHLVEHTICTESKKYSPEVADALLARTCGAPDGGSWYINTDRTVTAYGSTGNLKKKHARELFSMFADMIKTPAISRHTVFVEKAAVHQEHYLTGQDIPGERIHQMFREEMFPESFLVRIPIDGYIADVRSITRHDIKEHIHKHYTPSNVFVVYLGPRYKDVKEVIHNELGTWTKNVLFRKPRFILPQGTGGFAPLSESRTKTTALRGLTQCHAAIGFPTETYLTEDAEALDVLAFIMGRKMFGELRAKNTVWESGTYRTPVYTERTFGHGMWYLHFASLDKNFVNEGVKVFESQCKSVCENILDKNEIETAIGYMYDYEFKELFSADQSGLMEEIIDAVSNGDMSLDRLHARGDRLLQFLKASGRNKLQDVARKYFTNNATVIINPEQ